MCIIVDNLEEYYLTSAVYGTYRCIGKFESGPLRDKFLNVL